MLIQCDAVYLLSQTAREAGIRPLYIPAFINDYNHFMGSVDLANQFPKLYEVHRVSVVIIY